MRRTEHAMIAVCTAFTVAAFALIIYGGTILRVLVGVLVVVCCGTVAWVLTVFAWQDWRATRRERRILAGDQREIRKLVRR